MFEKLAWQKDRVLLDDLVFRLEHYKNDQWDLGNDCFIFYKTRPIVDLYAKFWSRSPDFHARNILELGMWDGGSVAFWFEHFQPDKHVGIDLQPKQDSPYFRKYVASRGLENRIKTYWSTNQADTKRLREIVNTEFSGPLDLVIDDASHMYEFTKISFETLFPLLRPGGLYVIEDWPWCHWKEFQVPDHPWVNKTELDELIFELIEATASAGASRLSPSVTITPGFAVIERGEASQEDMADFKIERYITRRPQDRRAQGHQGEQTTQALKTQITALQHELNRIHGSRAWQAAQKGQRAYQFIRSLGQRLAHPANGQKDEQG